MMVEHRGGNFSVVDFNEAHMRGGRHSTAGTFLRWAFSI
jgi:hypothetical protein